MTITLRATEPADYPYLESWWNDTVASNGIRDTANIPTNGQAGEPFHDWTYPDDENRFGRTIIGPSGLVIGYVGAYRHPDAEREATLGLFIGTYFQGHGYGSQAMKQGVRLAVDLLHADTVASDIWAFNLRARHMCESLGFTETARHEKSVERDGRLFDAIVYTAPVGLLLDRITKEEGERLQGERLEQQRFEAERQSDMLPRR